MITIILPIKGNLTSPVEFPQRIGGPKNIYKIKNDTMTYPKKKLKKRW